MANVTQLPGTEQVMPFKQAVAMMIEQLPDQLKYIDMKATMTRRAYQKLIDEGFTRNEALQLCTKIY